MRYRGGWEHGRRTRIKDAQSRTLATVRPSRRDVRAAQSPTVIRHGLVSHLAALYTRPGRVASAVLSFPLFLSLSLLFYLLPIATVAAAPRRFVSFGADAAATDDGECLSPFGSTHEARSIETRSD